MKSLHTLHLAILGFLALAAAASAQQTQRDWGQPAAGTYEWLDTNNWVGGNIPDTPGEYGNFAASGTNAIDRAASITVNVSSNLTVARITSGTGTNTGTNFGFVTVTGSDINLEASGGSGVDALARIERANSSLGTSPGLVVSNNLVLADPDGGRLLANGPFVVGGSISGTNLLRKDGAHPVFLGGTNTWSGGTLLNQSTLVATNTAALGFTGGLNFSNATNGAIGIGTLASGTTVLNPGAITLASGSAQTLFAVAGSNNVLDIQASTWSNGTGTNTILVNNVSGSGDYGITAPSGAGVVRFSGTGFTIERGLQGSGGNADVAFAPASGTQTWNGNFTGFNQNRTFVKSGAGTLVFNGNITTGTRADVSAGAFFMNGIYSTAVTGGAGFGSATNGKVFVAGGAIFGGNGRINVPSNTTSNANNMVYVSASGTLAPGYGLGTLVIDGTNFSSLGGDDHLLKMAAGAEFAFQVAGDGSTGDVLSFWSYNAANTPLSLSTNVVNVSLAGLPAPGSYTRTIMTFFSDGGTTPVAHGFSNGLTVNIADTNITSATINYDASSGQAISLSYTVAGAPASPYGSWLTNYPTLTDTNLTADPEGDGFINFSEFAFDGNPTVGSPALVQAVKTGTNATFTFTARNDSLTNYHVMSTTNLASGPWVTNTNVTVTNAADQSGVLLTNDYVRRSFTVPLGGTPQEFYRVKAVLTP